MAKKIKCRLSTEWLSRQTEEMRTMVLNYLKNPAYDHLCPCPKTGGGWGYKAECPKCGNGIWVDVKE